MIEGILLLLGLWLLYVISKVIEGILRNERDKYDPEELGSNLPDSWFGIYKKKKK